MKSPSRPPTPATSLATPPRTTPPTARSAGIWSRPSSALAPRAESTANSPNRRIAHAPKEMGDHPLNMIAGKCSDWNSMCQKRRGRPRSIVRSKPERIAPTAATSYPVRMTGRSSAPPNQSKRADRKYAPPASPPTKKYGIMNQVQWGAPVKKESDISRASPRAALLVHAPLPQADERQHAQDGGARHREGGALGEVPQRKLWMPRQPVYLGFVDEEVERIDPAERPFRASAVRTPDLFDEPDRPHVDAVQHAGVVVAVAAPLPDPAVRGWELVQFLARDLARLAADANRGVGEESHGLGHIRPSPRCRRTPCLRGSTRWGRRPRR